MVYHGHMGRDQRNDTEFAKKLRQVVDIVKELADGHRRLYKHRPDQMSRDTMRQLSKLESEVLKLVRGEEATE